MAIKLKPRKTPSNLFQKYAIKSMFFQWLKTEIGVTMATLLFRALKMGIFQNILYLRYHISDKKYFQGTNV